MNQIIENVYGKDLIFISQINFTGTGMIDIFEKRMNFEFDTKFKLTALSISQKTFIASEFNTYTVKLKQQIS